MRRERAFELLRQGRRVRPPNYPKTDWVRLDGDCVVHRDGQRLVPSGIAFPHLPDGWTLLARTKAELRAALAKAEATIQKMVADGLSQDTNNEILYVSLVKETERRECAERCMAQLQTELAEAEERAKVAEKESAERHERFVAANQGWTRAEHQRDDAYKRAHKAEAEVATLTAECERLRAVAPRFKVGDRVLFRPEGKLGTVVRFEYEVQLDHEQGITTCCDWDSVDIQPAPDAKPAEPVWKVGDRVTRVDGTHEGALLAVTKVYDDGNVDAVGLRLWFSRLPPRMLKAWSDPLPETEGGAK